MAWLRVEACTVQKRGRLKEYSICTNLIAQIDYPCGSDVHTKWNAERGMSGQGVVYTVEIYIVSQPRWQIWPRMFSLNESARGPCAFLRDLSKNLPSSYRVSWLSSYTDAS